MAIMNDASRIEVWAEMMRDHGLSISHPVASGKLIKPEHRAVIDALDQWLSDNALAANNAIPQPQRGLLSTEEKAIYLMRIIAQRYLTGV